MSYMWYACMTERRIKVANCIKGPRPWTVKNKGRLGMLKPLLSGKPPRPADDPATNFTLRIGVKELSEWRKEADAEGLSIGSMVRAAVSDYLEEVRGETDGRAAQQ